MEDLLVKRLNSPVNANRTASSYEAHAIFATTLGLVRKENEDRALVARFYSIKYSSFVYCYILSDGMGGMANGGLAATLTVSHFLSQLTKTIESYESIELSIKQAVQYAHEKVCDAIQYKGGATLSAIVTCKPNELYTVNVGDSRIYQCTNNQSILQITEDDDVRSFLSKIEGIPLNSVLAQRNGLTKFMGMEGDLELNVEVSYSTSDFFIISDGISLVGDENIQKLYESCFSYSEFLQRCIHLSNWFGGKDNATGIYVNFSKMSSLNIPEQVSYDNLDTTISDYIEVWDFNGSFVFPKEKPTTPTKNLKQPKRKTTKKVPEKQKIKTSSIKDDDTMNVEITTIQPELLDSDGLPICNIDTEKDSNENEDSNIETKSNNKKNQ
ncbi:PP2C family protein-serine/threonine phosphatase [Vibrio fluvialis]|uniref:PP2C family protein-serine/threonine phosphatase n=1 Tax=Vibrio fluvialis TaxID=676 RepID=UPI0006475B99|nr:PP2C family serine/threonine-protein phosphatase [Vibrio fluvialis]